MEEDFFLQDFPKWLERDIWKSFWAKLILTVSCFLHHVNYFPLRGRDFLEWYFSAIQSQVGSTKKLLSSTYNLPPEHFTPPLLHSDSVKLIILLGIQKIHSRRILYNVYISHWDPCAKVNTEQEKYIWNKHFLTDSVSQFLAFQNSSVGNRVTPSVRPSLIVILHLSVVC